MNCRISVIIEMAAHNSSKTQDEPKGPTFEIQKCVVLTPKGSGDPRLTDLFPNGSAERSAEGQWVTCLQVEKNDKKEVNLVAAGSFWDHLKPDRDQRCDLAKLFAFVNPPNQGPLHDAFLITGPASLAPTTPQESAKKSSIFYVIPYFESSEESERHLKRTLCQIASHHRVFIIVKPDLRARLNELVKPYKSASVKITIISDLRQFKTRIANLPSPKHEIDCISADKFKRFVENKPFALLSELQNVFEKQESMVQRMLCTFHDLGLVFCQGRSIDVQDPIVFTKPNYLYDFLSEANTVPLMDDDPDSATLEGFLGYSCAVFSDLYAVIDQLSELLTCMGVTIDLNGDATFRHSLPTMDSSDITDIQNRFFAQPLRFTVRQQCSISDTMYWQFVSKFSHRYGSKYADPVYNQNYSCFGLGPGSFLHIYKEGSSWIEVGYEQQAVQLKKQANRCYWPQHIFEKLSEVKSLIESCLPGQELCIGFPCTQHPEAIAELQETDPNDSLQAFSFRCNHRDCSHSDMEWKQRIWYHKPDRFAQCKEERVEGNHVVLKLAEDSEDKKHSSEQVDGPVQVLQGSPNDAGLQGVINHSEIGVNWLKLVIALGVPTPQIDTSSKPEGLSAFQHWRNGRVDGAQTTWEFLLERVTETIGPEVTKKLKEDIFSHPHWTE